MISIRTYDPLAIKRHFPAAGIQSSSVVFNPPSDSDDIKVVLTVGGHNNAENHCFVQHAAGKPWIQCLDPRDIYLKGTNLAFILCALQKAAFLDQEVFKKPSEEILIGQALAVTLQFLEDAQNGDILSIDIETNMSVGEITCIAIAYHDTFGLFRSISIPFERSGNAMWSIKDEAILWRAIASLLNKPIPKLFQNFIFDTLYLSKFGIRTEGPILDTMVLAHLINPELPKGLHDLGRLYLTCEPWKNIASYESTEDLWRYNALDALRTLQIYQNMQSTLDATHSKATFWNGQLVPLATEILRLCERGWTVDKGAIASLSKTISEELDPLLVGLKIFANPLLIPHIEMVHRKMKYIPGREYFTGEGTRLRGKKILFTSYKPLKVPEKTNSFRTDAFKGLFIFEKVVTARDFNPLSSDDCRDLFIALGYKIPTYKGSESMDERAILRIHTKRPNPVFAQILRARGLRKMLSTYVRVRLDEDEKLRFSINMAGTVEGRFSSSQTPWDTGLNIQNLPKKFRHICVPASPGWSILNLDAKAADPHMVAWLSGEHEMLRVLRTPGADLHAHTASKIVGRDITKDLGYDKDTSTDRKLGKAANNGLNYGMGVEKFKQEVLFQTGLDISLEDATRTYNGYFAAYPGIRAWHTSVRTQIMGTRTLSTPFGRTRFFHGNLRDDYAFGKILNSALAWIPPTTVADAINCGWLRFVSLANEAGICYNILQQCHDSLMMEVSNADLFRASELLKKAYASVQFSLNGFTCCFPVEISSGPNFGALEAIKENPKGK